ncbi:Retrovirus-related Pol polyprotein from transposon TNT 1-94-like protein [Drosera capensis]
MEDEYKNEWIGAMKSEMNSLHANHTYDLVQFPKDKRTLKNRWIFRIKKADKDACPLYMLYLEQPEVFVVKGKESYVCRLKKSLYGLKQTPRQ